MVKYAMFLFAMYGNEQIGVLQRFNQFCIINRAFMMAGVHVCRAVCRIAVYCYYKVITIILVSENSLSQDTNRIYTITLTHLRG